ncbi:GHKL domain-containing protein [Bacillus sp. 165]|nr:PAS domain-containing sensor histidine kinase [Bacillus sp. 165]MBO9128446.1 GHKL domain-containing protein [Bacillus sp. 165]
MKQENKEQTKAVADLYRDYLNRYIGEASSGLEMLALVVNTTHKNKEAIEKVLKSTNEKDARFSGFYYANADGILFLGSHPIINPVNIADRPYIQEVLNKKKTTVSPAVIDRINHNKAIAIATPVLSPFTEVTGILISSLRFNYISDTLNRLEPKYDFEVSDNTGTVFLHNNEHIKHTTDNEKITLPVDKAQWQITVYSLPINKSSLYPSFFIELLVSLFLTNIIFLLIKYTLLKQQAKLERRQNEVQKLELVGALAASTAHEIRNPLTGIKGLVTLLSEKYNAPEDQFYFTVIQKEIDRINEIVSEFLILGKPTAVKQQIYDLKDIIKEVSLIIQSEANLHGIELITVMEDKDIPIDCSKDHIKQVILNITKNAFEAMKQGHTLTIEVGSRNEKAQIRITDTGAGMPDQIKKKIFDPFFTSKKTGTGLGLVVCKRIVDMYNGEVSIISTEGKGTTVHILLPLANI